MTINGSGFAAAGTFSVAVSQVATKSKWQQRLIKKTSIDTVTSSLLTDVLKSSAHHFGHGHLVYICIFLFTKHDK